MLKHLFVLDQFFSFTVDIMNSTIKQKMGICADCNDSVTRQIIAGRCPFHYKLHRNKVNAEKKKSRLKPTNALEKTFGIGRPQSELFLWYAKKMKESQPICENCGTPINKYDQKGWHGSQAHILGKEHFPSIATHPDNHMVLSMYNCSCHGQWDTNFANAEKMDIFPVAKERFKKFESCIASPERRRIPECFLKD